MSTTTERPAVGAVRPLTEIRAGDADEVGARRPGELIAAGFPVSGGFVLPAEAYLTVVDAAGVQVALATGHEEARAAGPDRLSALCTDLADRVCVRPGCPRRCGSTSAPRGSSWAVPWSRSGRPRWGRTVPRPRSPG